MATLGPKDEYGNDTLPIVSPQVGVVFAGVRICGADIYTGFNSESHSNSYGTWGWDAGISFGEQFGLGIIIATNNIQLFKFHLSAFIVFMSSCQRLWRLGCHYQFLKKKS